MRTAWIFVLSIAACTASPAPALDAASVDVPTSSDHAEVGVDRAPEVASPPVEPPTITRTPIGTPGWEVVGFQQFAATVGTPQTQLAEGTATLSRVLRPGHAFQRLSQYFGPASPHPGPYDLELRDNVSREGFVHSGRFTVAEITAPRGIFLVLTVAPREGAPRGRSADAPDGPILPNELFPLGLMTDTYRDGVLWEPTIREAFPSPRMVSPPRDEDGWSHLHLLWANYFLPGDTTRVHGPGRFEWRITIVDARRMGWRVVVPYAVVGE